MYQLKLKKLTKTILCAISIFTLLFNQISLSIPTAVAASPSLKVLFAKCDGTEGAIFHPGGLSGNDRTFSASAPDYWNNYKVVPANSVDLTGCDTLTFDMYISDQAAFDEWKSHMSFMIGDGTKFYTWPMRDDLVVGTTSISLDLTLAIASGVDISAVTEVIVKTHSEGTTDFSTQYNFNTSWKGSTQDLSIALLGIYGVYVPEPIVQNVLFSKGHGLDEGAIYHPGGSTWRDKTLSASNPGWFNNYFVRPLSSVDLSGCNTLTFAMYISDVAAYEEWKTHMRFIISSEVDSVATYYTWPMQQDLVQGFNSITLYLTPAAKSGVNLSAVYMVGVKTYPTGAEDVNVNVGWLDSTQDLLIAFKDIYGHHSEESFYAKCDGTEGIILHPGGEVTNIRTLSSTNPLWINNYMIDLGVGKDFTGCSTLMYELYISDQAAYEEWKSHMKFAIRSGTTTFFTWPMREDLVVGYNCIELDLAPAIAGGIDITNVTGIIVKSYYEGTTDFTFNSSWMNSTQNLTIAMKDIYARSPYQPEEIALNSSSFNISTDNFISNVQPTTTTKTVFEAGIQNSQNYELTYLNINNNKIATGTTVTAALNVDKKTYTFVVYGDVSGDGEIGLGDLAIIRDVLCETDTLEGAFAKAGDLYGEDKITLNDLVGLMAYVSESGDINQDR